MMGMAVEPCIITAVLLCFAAVAAQNLTNFLAGYNEFDSGNQDQFQLQNSANFSNGVVQLTYWDQSTTVNVSGRVMLKKRFKLWEQRYNQTWVASFNSSFIFRIIPLNNFGEGLAFVLAPDTDIPSNSSGQYLGLTNSSTDGSPENRFVAIEFDNFKEDFDPDANHVGLDINSIESNTFVSLTPLGINLTSESYVAWVQYDGVNKVIEVYIEPQADWNGNLETRSGPSIQVLKSNLDLSEVLNQYSYFGFSASTGDSLQSNTVSGWSLTVVPNLEDAPAPASAAPAASPAPVPAPASTSASAPAPASTLALALGPAPAPVPASASATALKDKHLSREKIILVVGFPVLMMGAAVMCYYYLRKKPSMAQSKYNVLLGTLKRLPGTPREFQFKDLKKATKNFDEKKKLGQGGFGVVYRGYLENENLEVAVKWFSRKSIKGQNDFLAELIIINRLRHKHLVRLLGWCHNKGKLLLVYDYMPNGSLDTHLFTKALEKKPLSWDLRYKIIVGVASALHYLHDEYNQRVVHRDLKASNIMLDSNFNARLGDFGLARALDTERTSYTEAGGVAGTLGYIAPEYFHTGKATQQSDVYAFGIVLLEIVCGLRPRISIDDFYCSVDWVWFLYREGRILDAIEKRLADEYVVEEAQKVLILALACCHPIAGERPKTQTIVQILSSLVSVPYVPPFKPAFVWPSMPSMEEDDSCTMETSSYQTIQLRSDFTPQCINRELCAIDKVNTV